MNDIDWADSSNEENNLSGVYKDKKVQLVKDFNGKWQVLFNNIRFQDGYGFTSRAEAQKWVDEVNIFDQLCRILSRV